MKRRASEPLPAAILHKKAAKVSQNHKTASSQISKEKMKENVEPVPDVDNFSNQEILEAATDEEALPLFSNIEFDIDDINDLESDAKIGDSKDQADLVANASDQDSTSSSSSDSDSQQSTDENMMTQVVQHHQPEAEVEQVGQFFLNYPLCMLYNHLFLILPANIFDFSVLFSILSTCKFVSK